MRNLEYIQKHTTLTQILFSLFQIFLLIFVGVLLVQSNMLTFVPHSVSAATNPSVYKTRLVELINGERQKAGLSSLAIQSKLEQAADSHNKTMDSCSVKFGADPCFTHQVTQLSEPKLMDRIKQTGYTPTAVGENIAWGYKTPEEAVQAWMRSSGHKGMILNTTMPEIGCAYTDGNNGDYRRLFWTCDFGKSSGATQGSSVTPPPAGGPTKQATQTPTPRRAVRNTEPEQQTTPRQPLICRFIPTHASCKQHNV